MTRIDVVKHVAADPASVALLLAEPATEGDRESIVLTPPRRSGVGFSAAVEVSDIGEMPAVGEVVVQPGSDAGCEVRLVLHVPNQSARHVERAGSRFLSELALRARSRSRAA